MHKDSHIYFLYSLRNNSFHFRLEGFFEDDKYIGELAPSVVDEDEDDPLPSSAGSRFDVSFVFCFIYLIF